MPFLARRKPKHLLHAEPWVSADQEGLGKVFDDCLGWPKPSLHDLKEQRLLLHDSTTGPRTVSEVMLIIRQAQHRAISSGRLSGDAIEMLEDRCSTAVATVEQDAPAQVREQLLVLVERIDVGEGNLQRLPDAGATPARRRSTETASTFRPPG